MTITGRGVAPVAIDDFVFTRGGQAIVFNPLANDVDGDEELSLERLLVTGGPSSGSLARTDQGLVYTPNEGFAGSDQVTYSIEDSLGNIASATVEITVGSTLGPVVIPGETLTLFQRADTNGDTRVTAIDALRVINFVNLYGLSLIHI